MMLISTQRITHNTQKYKNIDDQLKNYSNKCYDKKTNVFNVEYIKPKHKWGGVPY